MTVTHTARICESGVVFHMWGRMESDRRYYERRLKAETLAADRALTDAARQRRLRLVASFRSKLDSACA